ncbi:hypothetical protein OIV83_002254 [Microbotryomycetes sp. JL201]|nr:hypothetical protein OIV83_002254 [Microbotryomycetes sp. JL201]
MSEDAAAQRKAAQAARQAKLLAKSQDRLAKITGAAPDGRVPNDASLGIPSRAGTVNKSPPAPSSLLPDDDPAEIDLATTATSPAASGPNSQSAHSLATMTDTFGGNADAGGADDMFAQMLAQLTGQAGQQQNPFTGTNGQAPPNPFAAMMLNNKDGAPQRPVSPFPPQPKTLLDRIFPLIHFIAMVALAWYSVAYAEPANKIGIMGWTDRVGQVDWRSWGALASQRPARDVAGKVAGKSAEALGVGLAQVPMLWLFVSVELVLQTTRILLVRNQPDPPGILNSIMPILSQFSPQLGLALQTAVKYLALVSVLVTDLSVLLFSIGAIIIMGRWKTGGVPLAFDQMVETGSEALHAIKGEL